MKELKDIICNAQNNDKNAMMEIIEMFQPLLNKLTRYMHYDEDFKSEITMYLIELIHTIKLSNMQQLCNSTLFSYIKQSLYRRYILISKKRRLKLSKEGLYTSDDLEEWLCIDHECEDKFINIEIDTLMKKVLTEREYQCVKLIVINGLSSSEAAKKLGITKQSANESKIRGLSKLKKYLSKG